MQLFAAETRRGLQSCLSLSLSAKQRQAWKWTGWTKGSLFVHQFPIQNSSVCVDKLVHQFPNLQNCAFLCVCGQTFALICNPKMCPNISRENGIPNITKDRIGGMHISWKTHSASALSPTCQSLTLGADLRV